MRGNGIDIAQADTIHENTNRLESIKTGNYVGDSIARSSASGAGGAGQTRKRIIKP